MSQNDGDYGDDFENELQDEDLMDAHPQPMAEIGYNIERDCGSGSYAEDGRREVREDRPIMDGEIGSAAMYGPTEIGDDEIGNGPYASHGAFELGAASAADRPGSELGSGWAANEGFSEIGAGEDNLGTDALMQPFETFMMESHRLGEEEVGSAAMYGPTEIGAYAEDGASEVGDGPYAAHGAHEIGAAAAADRDGSELGEGWAANEGASEIGEDDLEDGARGAGWYARDGASEIGDEEAKVAVVKVVEKARDNRQPAPPMRAVDVDSPPAYEVAFLADIVLGAAVAAPGASEPFPLLSQMLLRAGTAIEPRIVRVDTEESYKQFRTSQSPELSAVQEKLEEHLSDPNAHESDDIDSDISDLVMLGEEAQAAEAQKRVDLWMPTRFDGKVEAWKQGDKVFASIALPGCDGEVRICTAFEPMRKCVEELMRHASETPGGAAVVGAGLAPAMGCVLGAGTVMKEMAAAAPAILARPEAQVKLPFVVRIEPKISPNLAALVMLAAAAKMGNTQAVSEWTKLASASAPAVRSAMLEASEVAKAATGG